jgi:hypothetical protein
MRDLRSESIGSTQFVVRKKMPWNYSRPRRKTVILQSKGMSRRGTYWRRVGWWRKPPAVPLDLNTSLKRVTQMHFNFKELH